MFREVYGECNHSELLQLTKHLGYDVSPGLTREELIEVLMGERQVYPHNSFNALRLGYMQFVLDFKKTVLPQLECPASTAEMKACYGCHDTFIVACAHSSPKNQPLINIRRKEKEKELPNMSIVSVAYSLKDLVRLDNIDEVFKSLPAWKLIQLASQLKAEGFSHQNQEEIKAIATNKDPEAVRGKFAPSLKQYADTLGVDTSTESWVRFLKDLPDTPKVAKVTPITAVPVTPSVKVEPVAAVQPVAPITRTPVAPVTQLMPPVADDMDEEPASDKAKRRRGRPRTQDTRTLRSVPAPVPHEDGGEDNTGEHANTGELSLAQVVAQLIPSLRNVVDTNRAQLNLFEKIQAVELQLQQQQEVLHTILNKVLTSETITGAMSVQVEAATKTTQALAAHVDLLTTIVAKTGMAATGMSPTDLTSDSADFMEMLSAGLRQSVVDAGGKEKASRKKKGE
jgi:hypothetical protein